MTNKIKSPVLASEWGSKEFDLVHYTQMKSDRNRPLYWMRKGGLTEEHIKKINIPDLDLRLKELEDLYGYQIERKTISVYVLSKNGGEK